MMLILACTTFVCAYLSNIHNAHAKSVDTNCRKITAIFARGSGQDLGKEEHDRFVKQLGLRIPNELINYYELGTETYGDKYQAISVDSWVTKIGAWTSAGHGNAYGESVLSGVTELLVYITQRHQKCPDSHFILAGYSQGAQVVSETLFTIPKQVRAKISFVALFGDPKLYLPEGEGFDPPACHGEQYSPWRRVIGNCDTDNGSLGARKPYLPVDMENKVGLWCNDADVVCGSSKTIAEGHFTYDREHGAIDQAALEIAIRLYNTVLQDEFISRIPDLSASSIGPDVMIAIDQDDLAHYYDDMLASTDKVIDKVIGAGGRVGFMTYKHCFAMVGVGFNEPLSGTIEDLRPYIDPPTAQTSCDYTSYPLFNTIGSIKDNSQWRDGADKLIIIVGRTAYGGSSDATVGFAPKKLYYATLANSNPDFYLYPMISGDANESFQNLDIENATTNIISKDNLATVITQHTTIAPQLQARLTSQDYRAFPGDDLTFDASPSLVHDDEIVKYEWFFGKQVKGVPVPSITGTSPIVHYTYDSTFDGTMSVRITTASGLTDTVTADVLIRDPATIPPMAKAPVNLQVTRISATSAKITWDAADDLATSWLVSLNGFPLGRVAKNQHFLTITDLLTDQANTFSVQPIMLSDERGEAARVTLQPSTVQRPLENFFTDPTSNPQHPAATFVAAVTKLLDLDTKKATDTTAASDAAPSTTLHEQQKVAQPSLLLYVIGGVIACGLTGLAGWFAYKKLLTK